jgi:hypothetical protein
MSAQEIIAQIKELPPGERARVARYVMENDDSWISEQGTKDADHAAWSKLSEKSLMKAWDNADDDVFNELLEK